MAARRGYAWGMTDGGEWLTIAGSAWRAPVLAETPEAAVRDDDPWTNTLALVEERWHPGVSGDGRAYKILERVN